MQHAVVLSPGRTGSRLITLNLQRYFHTVKHTHQPIFDPKNSNVIGVISYRRDNFAAMMSMLLGYETKEYEKYSDQQVNPFEMDPHAFRNFYIHYHMFYRFIKTEYYTKTVDVYFEDMMQDPKYLFSLLGIDATTDYTVCEKSPRRFTDYIINADELKHLHTELEKDKEKILAESGQTFRYVGAES